jgi:ATP-dependent RNA helicase DHX29
MAPKKKTKKPLSNPARGFATTSTVSKAKFDPVVEDDETNARDSDRVNKPDQGSANVPTQEDGEAVEKALHELRPEDLEKQLEESALQVFAESHGNKVKKETSRQAVKLQTERRLLRAQAEPLATHQWLPIKIIQLILNLSKSLDAQPSRSDEAKIRPDFYQGSPHLSDDDLLVKLWTLRQLLPQLGFSLTVIHLALQHLLDKLSYVDMKSIVTAKDSVWGLDECLSWLALVCKPEELPKLEPHDVQKLPGRGRKFKGTTIVAEEGKF